MRIRDLTRQVSLNQKKTDEVSCNQKKCNYTQYTIISEHYISISWLENIDREQQLWKSSISGFWTFQSMMGNNLLYIRIDGSEWVICSVKGFFFHFLRTIRFVAFLICIAISVLVWGAFSSGSGLFGCISWRYFIKSFASECIFWYLHVSEHVLTCSRLLAVSKKQTMVAVFNYSFKWINARPRSLLQSKSDFRWCIRLWEFFLYFGLNFVHLKKCWYECKKKKIFVSDMHFVRTLNHREKVRIKVWMNQRDT